MIDAFRQMLISQYEGALSMLKGCVDMCPDAVWNSRVATYKFCQVAFHTLFYTDYYLGADPDSFKRQRFHVQNPQIFRDYEELEDRVPVQVYEKEQILAVLAHCREKTREVFAKETWETLMAPHAFRTKVASRAELHIHNIRHIQHHTAQLSLRLRLDTNEGVAWVSGGWRELAELPTPAQS